MALFRLGASQVYIAKKTGVSRVTVNKWFAKYRKGGLEAVLRQPPRRQPSLADNRLEELRQAVTEGPRLSGFSRAYWTHRDIAAVIERRFGLRYSLGTVRILLRRAKLDRSNCKWLSRPPRRSPGPPGRPPRVSLEKVRGLGQALRAPPRASGVAAAEWTPEVVAELMVRRFGVTYCQGYIRRLLRRAGIDPDTVMRWKKRAMPLGRRRRVPIERVRELEPALRASPRASGLSAAEWAPELIAGLIRERFGASYSAGYIPSVLRAAGIDPDAIMRSRRRLVGRRGASMIDMKSSMNEVGL